MPASVTDDDERVKAHRWSALPRPRKTPQRINGDLLFSSCFFFGQIARAKNRSLEKRDNAAYPTCTYETMRSGGRYGATRRDTGRCGATSSSEQYESCEQGACCDHAAHFNLIKQPRSSLGHERPQQHECGGRGHAVQADARAGDALAALRAASAAAAASTRASSRAWMRSASAAFRLWLASLQAACSVRSCSALRATHRMSTSSRCAAAKSAASSETASA